MPTTKTIEVFKIDELSDDAKETAINKQREYVFNEPFEWEHIFDDTKEIGKILGIDIKNIYYSGFSSQGDGACFEGYYSYNKHSVQKLMEYAPQDERLHQIAKELYQIQKKYFFSITANIKHRGHYYHEMCTEIDVNDRFNENSFYGESSASEDVKEILRDFMRWIYRSLEKEYDYQMKEETILENIRANSYEYLENGKMA